MKGWLWGAAFAAAIGGALAASQSPTASRSAAGIALAVTAVPVLLDPQDAAQHAIGAFHYAGGLALTSPESDGVHGLSDLEITGTDRFIAIGDTGTRVEARLVFDGAGRLAGMTDAHLWPLVGEDGAVLSDKAEADAEGMALLADGSMLVSFERHHRILSYPTDGRRPLAVPWPEVPFPANEGMEALGADPDAGADAYFVGGEASGETWTCHVSTPVCTKRPSVQKDGEFGLVAMKRLTGMTTAYLLRAYDERIGNRVSLQLFRGGTMIDRLDLARPLTIDNFEGVAGVPGPDGGIRFYLLSDDNASASQRTLLLAFDWRPR